MRYLLKDVLNLRPGNGAFHTFQNEECTFILQPDDRTGLYCGRVQSTSKKGLEDMKAFFKEFNAKHLDKFTKNEWKAVVSYYGLK